MTADSEISTQFRIPKRCRRLTFGLSGPGFYMMIQPASDHSIRLHQFVADNPTNHPPTNCNQVVLDWLTDSVTHLRQLCEKKP